MEYSLFLRWFNESEDVHSLCAAGGDQVHVISAERETVDLYEPVKEMKERRGGREGNIEDGQTERERVREREREDM